MTIKKKIDLVEIGRGAGYKRGRRWEEKEKGKQGKICNVPTLPRNEMFMSHKLKPKI